MLCTAAVSGGTSPGADGRSRSVSISLERVDEAGDVGDVLACVRLAVLAGARVDDLDALAEVGEARRGPAPGRCRSSGRGRRARTCGGAERDGVLDDVRRDAHHARLAVDAAAAVAEDVERLVVLDPTRRCARAPRAWRDAAAWLWDGKVPGQAGNNHPKTIPTGTFKATDGHINIGSGSQTRWKRLCKAIGQPALLERPGFVEPDDRSLNRDEVNAVLGTVFETKPMAHWVEVLNKAGVPCGPIYKIDQVFADPQVRHTGIAAKVRHPVLGDKELVGQPIHMSRTPWKMRSAAPDLGEQSDAILAEIGYDAAAIGRLRVARSSDPAGRNHGDAGHAPSDRANTDRCHMSSRMPASKSVDLPPRRGKRTASERSAAWLAHQSGGLGVGGSNPLAPTNIFKGLRPLPQTVKFTVDPLWTRNVGRSRAQACSGV